MLGVALAVATACGHPFDAGRWREGDALVRGRMADEIISSRILVGKTHSEVVNLLGQAEYDAPSQLSYTIDLRTKASDPAYLRDLIVRFDEHGEAQDSYVDW